jgi:precorrin-6Y C5,15-methyltransferase (decarboxylating)
VTVTIVGIGADGWPGLPAASRLAVETAEVVYGGPRQLDLLPPSVTAQRIPWPSPLLPALPEFVQDGGVVLASGDPMFFGIGSTLARLGVALRVLPHPSSVSLACARLGWALEDVAVVSLVGRPPSLMQAFVHPQRRILVLSASRDTPAEVAGLLAARGYGDSRITVLSQLGSASETVTGLDGPIDDLNIVAVECVGTAVLPAVPGLPDDAYEHDGQLTKREIRSVTLARLAPVPGQLLWDVGAGSGSIGIEWMRTHRSCRAIAVESRAERAARVALNADALGVPGLRIVHGCAPAALLDLPAPDAVFVGGGATAPGVLERCWDALRPGGRLVVNAVTIESESLVARWQSSVGGDLTRLSVQRADKVGGFLAWRPMMPVTQWTVTR